MRTFRLVYLLGFTCFPFFMQAQESPVKVKKDLVVIQEDSISKALKIFRKAPDSKKKAPRYTIQVYSGSFKEATSILEEVKDLFPGYPVELKYETPNYKVWVGSFKKQLDAEYELKKVKVLYSDAFYLKR